MWVGACFPMHLKTNLCFLLRFFFLLKNSACNFCVDTLVQHTGLSCQICDVKTSVDLAPKPPGFSSVKYVRSEKLSTTFSKPQVSPSAIESLNGDPPSTTPHVANPP